MDEGTVAVVLLYWHSTYQMLLLGLLHCGTCTIPQVMLLLCLLHCGTYTIPQVMLLLCLLHCGTCTIPQVMLLLCFMKSKVQHILL